MTGLSYRGSDDGEMMGKPRVFFAAHPAELPYYLEQVVSWLHASRDCVIWYPASASDDGEGPAAELKASEVPGVLDDMQLVVVAVTVKLLHGDNSAMDRVIPYAQAHHIPLLPLIMEPKAGTDPLYNVRFKNLQYLEPSASDPTALPFADKLKSYLDDVLISDETAERVRKVFDACVFLSYRKKDRAFARELMRMIHKDPKYRGISFWYDEFLTPGEDFNENIKKALSSCDLFALVVTPSMLEIPNYVMDEEYPSAIDEGKDIFPVEMDKTDRELLEKHFRDIPACVTGVEDDEWAAALSEKLAPLAVRTQSSDAEHTYLTGLAYLDGIGVEVDLDVAANLITEAFNDGLEEAARKLAAMYLTGKGVPQSVLRALSIQDVIVDMVRKRYLESGTDEDLAELYREMRIYDDRCWEMKARMGSCVDEMLGICHKLYSEDPAAEAIEKADCLMRRARAGYWDMIWTTEFEEPEADFLEAVRVIDETLAQLGKAGETEEAGKSENGGKSETYRTALISEKMRVIREMAMMEQYKSHVLAKNNYEIEKTAEVHRKWIECADDLEAVMTGPAPIAERMKAYRQMGDIYAHKEMEEDAIRSYEQAAETAVRLLDINPTIEYRAPIEYIYNKLTDYEKKHGSSEKRREYRTRECAIHTIVKDAESAQNRSLYPLFDRAERAMIHGETDLAKSLYLRCAAGEGIDAKPPALWRFENKCLYRLDFFAAFIDNDPGESWEYRCRHLENQERIATLENTQANRRALAGRYEKMSAYAVRIDPQKALGWYRACLETWDALAAETGKPGDALNRELARQRLAYSGLLPDKESDDMVKEAETGFMKIAEEYRGTPEESGALTELGRLYRKRADACIAVISDGKHNQNGTEKKAELSGSEKKTESSGSEKKTESSGFKKLAVLSSFKKRAVLSRAAGLYKKSIDFLEKAAQTEDPEPALEELKSLYLDRSRKEGLPNVPDCFEKALETQRRLLTFSKTKSHLEDMGDLLFEIVTNAENREDVPADVYHEILAVYNRLGAGWPETQEEDASWLRSYISRDILVQKKESPYPGTYPWLQD